MQMLGSNCVILLTVVVPPAGLASVPVYSPGGEARGTTATHLTGSPFGMILTPPLTRLGSFHILVDRPASRRRFPPTRRSLRPSTSRRRRHCPRGRHGRARGRSLQDAARRNPAAGSGCGAYRGAWSATRDE